MKTTDMKQAPIRNANMIGASVYSHSGEFAPVFTDLQLTGRGFDFKFIRAYRSSLAGCIGDMGRGWTSSIAKKIERQDNDIIYHDGAGQVYKFVSGKNGNFTSPTGFYGVLLQEEKAFVIHERHGKTYRFDLPERDGRIVSIADRNQNDIQFSYSANSIVIFDTLKREIAVSVNKGLLQELHDHAGRTWKYTYDQNYRLIEVTQPTTADFPNGTSLKYAYDTNHRLTSVTDAKGQKYLVNTYDQSGKVVAQEHGSGVFRMEYDAIDENKSEILTYRTTCTRKNGSKIVIEHNEVGNVISSTLFVRKESFAPEDLMGISETNVPLITKSAYNKNSELISRTFPAGNKTDWVYSEDEKSPLMQGNLLQITEIPVEGVKSDQARIITKYKYEPKFQFTTAHINSRGNETSYKYDEKGNLSVTTYPQVTIQSVSGGDRRPAPLNRIQKDEYQYNSMGQLLRRRHIEGSITEYHYYPVRDLIGTHGLNTATNNPDIVCGYLARVVRDASGEKITNEYAYDNFGNVTTVWDGKSNPTRLRYNAIGRVERLTSREPFKYRIDYKYDANYNEIESAQTFDRLEYDETNQRTTITSSTRREIKEYNALDNVTVRKIVGDDKIITEYFIRDADEKIIRQLQPLGNATEYVYDERNLLIEKKFGAGTKETFSDRYTYTSNGAVRTYTDGNGKTTAHHYDGYHRYKGFTSPIGTKKTQWFDEADNVVRVEIANANAGTAKKTGVGHGGRVPLMEARYHFDQWNRASRVDKAWHDPSTGHPLGKSKWNGEEGIVSTVVEYAENGLPGKVWTETNNVVSVEYDGVGRAVKTRDLTGEEFFVQYDENNNPTLIKHLGPEIEGKRFERVVRRSYDAMDRLELQGENDEAPERFAYNALGDVIKYVDKAGMEIHYTDDPLGRRTGHVFTITDALDNTQAHKMVRRFEYDANYRLSAYTDAAGNRTMYRYDTFDRQTGVVFPDGNAANVDYDANGNIVRIVDQNKNEINNRYDASNRLVERRSLIENTGKETVEQYEYDGLSRMVGAMGPDASIRRTYDSLSRLLTEEQGDHKLRCAHDSAGNLTSLIYPGGEEIHKAYDIRNRVTTVKNKAEETIASFIYRASGQIDKMLLGKVIETDFFYNSQEHLESIEYRSTDDQKLVEGFRYQYDDSGRMTHEIQLSEGSTYGERYYYDNANRATKAQYGAQDVFDPNSPFEQETSYEHFPEGSWKRRRDIDGRGQVIAEKMGALNQLNKYQHFGDLSFKYDANGNCVRKGKPNPGYCLYAYDQDNKLIKVECYGAHGNKTKTIEYFYDLLGRQVRKVVTDQNGDTTEYTYVWAGRLLIEEYENGVLVRTYFYSIDSLPVQLTAIKGELVESYYYTHNGKGLASGLLHVNDPNAVAEKYHYELTGGSYVKEIGGVKVEIPSRLTTVSSLANSILSGDYLKDWDNDSVSSIGGIHLTPEIAAVLNGFGGKVYSGGASGAMGRQTQGYLDALGLTSGRKDGLANEEGGSGSQGALPPGAKNPRDQSLYGWVSYNGYSGASPPHFEGRPPHRPDPAVIPVNVGGAMVRSVVSLVFTTVTRMPGILLFIDDGGGRPSKQVEAAEAAKATAAAAAAAAAAAEAAEAASAAKAAEKDPPPSAPGDYPVPAEDEPVTVLTNPDADSTGGGSIRLPSPRQVEAILMRNKTPMNPNGGPGTSGIDISSLTPRRRYGGLDPTIAFIDGEIGIKVDAGTKAVMGGGYTDPVRRDNAPNTEGSSPPRRGTYPNTDN